jgi:acyl-CoA dehydrogenase
MFIGDPDEPVGLLERALAATLAAEPLERKVRDAVRSGRIDARLAPGEDTARLVERAVEAGVLNPAEAGAIAAQRVLAARVVRVDDFAQDLGTSLLAQDTATFGRPPITAPAPANAHERQAVAIEGFR